MGKTNSNEGIGHMLRKVKSSGGLAGCQTGSWAPVLGKMKKSSSSQGDLRLKINDAVKANDDLWGASEVVLTPNMLPKMMPDECPPTTPRELLHSIQRKSTGEDSVKGGQAGHQGQTGAGTDARTPRTLSVICEARKKGGSKLGGTGTAAGFEFDLATRDGGRVRASRDDVTPRRLPSALTSSFPGRQDFSDVEDDLPLTFRSQQTSRGPPTVPKGLQAALMMSQPLSDHWSDNGEDWCSDVLTTQSEFDEDFAPNYGQKYGTVSHWDVLSEESEEAPFHRTMSSISEEGSSEFSRDEESPAPEGSREEDLEEFRFPESRAVDFDQVSDVQSCMASWGIQDLSKWGERVCAAQESGARDGSKITTERSLFDLAVDERPEDQDTTVNACVDNPGDAAFVEPVYDDGAVYSLETGGGVYYVQKIGAEETGLEKIRCAPEGRDDVDLVDSVDLVNCCDGSGSGVEVEDVGVYVREGDRDETAVVYQEYEDYDEEDDAEVMESAFLSVDGLDDVEDDCEHRAPDKERMWSDDDEDDDGQRDDDDGQHRAAGASGSFDIGASAFFTTDQSVRPWGFGDDVNRDTSGCRDRSRASFDTADSSVIMNTGLNFRMAAISGGDRERSDPSWVVDTAHTYGSEREVAFQQGLQPWDTFQGGFGDMIPSFRNGGVDTMQTMSRYASEESYMTTKYWSAESWRSETYTQPRHRPQPYRGCPTPSSVLGSFFRRITEKLHLRKPAPKVPVCVTGGSECDGRRRRNRYNKRQASMLKFVEERLEDQDTNRTAGSADRVKAGRGNRRRRPDQDTIHDSAVDLWEYGAESSGVIRELPAEMTSARSENNGQLRPGDGRADCFGAGRRCGAMKVVESHSEDRFHCSAGRIQGAWAPSA